jgi:hypothetical protein
MLGADFLVPWCRQREPLDGGCLQLERIQHLREYVGHDADSGSN